MAEIMLEPYAVKQAWHLPGPDPDWQTFLRDYLQDLARACIAAGSPVLGHIKALSTFPGGGYFRISVVDDRHAPTCEGALPGNLPALELTLNLVVYGLQRESLRRVTAESCARMAEKYRGEVKEQPQAPAHHHHA